MLINFIQLFARNINCGTPTFFGLKPWYYYLNRGSSDCDIVSLNVLGTNGNGQSDFLLIGLAIVDDLLRVGALVAIGYVIVAGITYMTSQGSPDQTQKAWSTLLNALIGLVIVIVAIAAVNFFGSKIG